MPKKLWVNSSPTWWTNWIWWGCFSRLDNSGFNQIKSDKEKILVWMVFLLKTMIGFQFVQEYGWPLNRRIPPTRWSLKKRSTGNFPSSIFTNPPIILKGKGHDHPIPDTFSSILFVFPFVLIFFLFRGIGWTIFWTFVRINFCGTPDNNFHESLISFFRTISTNVQFFSDFHSFQR